MGGAATEDQSSKPLKLEDSKRADILILAENPVERLETLRDPVAVVAGGRLIARPAPKRNEKIESVLDGLMKEL